MNSADAWHPSNNPEGDMVPVLEASVEAAKQRHPSGKDVVTVTPPPAEATVLATLNAADRCDTGCGAAALYRVSAGLHVLDYCHHHHNKLFPNMPGWSVVGKNQSLYDELYNTNRLKGGDHA